MRSTPLAHPLAHALALALALAALLSACSALPSASIGVVPISRDWPASRDWRTVATTDDRRRLADWRSSLLRALAEARAAGHGAEITAEGALLAPDLVPRVEPLPNGRYRCRVIKLGHARAPLLGYVAYPAFPCRVGQEKDVQGFAKIGGSQRPIGLVFPDSPTRQVFLGTLVLGDEKSAMLYGHDAERDLAAWVEAVDGRRWRMIFPDPYFESRTDIIELVPAP